MASKKTDTANQKQSGKDGGASIRSPSTGGTDSPLRGARLENLSIDPPCTPPQNFDRPLAEDDDVFQGDQQANREYFERQLKRKPVRQSDAGNLRSAYNQLETGSPLKREQADPQHKYPASACVFIANATDEKLESEVRVVFSQFGNVFVKIKRDTNMPIAFAQFERDENALMALERGAGLSILGRPCRVEPSKKDHFIIFREDGYDMTVSEAIEVLKKYGAIASVEEVNVQHQHRLGHKGKGFVVLFKLWDGHRDTRLATDGHCGYNITRLEPKAKKAMKPGTKLPVCGQTFPDQRPSQNNNWRPGQAQQDTDSRTVYIGGLLRGTTEDDVWRVAGICGRIEKVVVLPVTGDNLKAVNAFAFVTFAQRSNVDTAISMIHNTAAPGGKDGEVLRCERKKPRNVANQNLSRSEPRLRRKEAFRAPPSDDQPPKMLTPAPETPAPVEKSVMSRVLVTPSPTAETRQEASPSAPATAPVQAYSMTPPLMPGYPGMMPAFTPPHAGLHPYMYGFTFPTPPSAWSGGYTGPYTYHTPVFDPAVVFQAYSTPPFAMSYQNSEISQGRPSQSEPGNGDTSSTQVPTPTRLDAAATEHQAPASATPQGSTATSSVGREEGTDVEDTSDDDSD